MWAEWNDRAFHPVAYISNVVLFVWGPPPLPFFEGPGLRAKSTAMTGQNRNSLSLSPRVFTFQSYSGYVRCERTTVWTDACMRLMCGNKTNSSLFVGSEQRGGGMANWLKLPPAFDTLRPTVLYSWLFPMPHFVIKSHGRHSGWI